MTVNMSWSDLNYYSGAMMPHSSTSSSRLGINPLRPAASTSSGGFVDDAAKNKHRAMVGRGTHYRQAECPDSNLISRAIDSVQKSNLYRQSSSEDCFDDDSSSQNGVFAPPGMPPQVLLPPSHHMASNRTSGASSPLRYDDGVDGIEHPNARKRSEELLRRANKVIGRASFKLSSSKKGEEKRFDGSHDPMCRGRVLFSGSKGNHPLYMGSPQHSEESNSRKLDPPTAEEPKFLSQDPPGSVIKSSTTSTTDTLSSSEQESHGDEDQSPVQSSAINPYEQYPDPDLYLSILSTNDSLVVSSASERRNNQGKGLCNKLRGDHSDKFYSQDSGQGGNRISKSRSTPNLNKDKDSWEHFGRIPFERSDDVDAYLQKYVPFVGAGRRPSRIPTALPNETNSRGQRHVQGKRTFKERAVKKSVGLSRDSRKLPSPDQFGTANRPVSSSHERKGSEDSMPSGAFSSISPISPDASSGTTTSSKDGHFDSPGHDSVSTLSAGSTVKRRQRSQRKEIPSPVLSHSNERLRRRQSVSPALTHSNERLRRKQSVSPALTHSNERLRRKQSVSPALTHSNERLRRKQSVSPALTHSNERLRRKEMASTPLTHSNEKIRVGFQTPISTGAVPEKYPTKTPPPQPHGRMGGPGGKFVVDGPMPVPTCCEVFFGSCRTSKPAVEHPYQSTQLIRTPGSSSVPVGKRQNYTPTTAGSPGSVLNHPYSTPRGGVVVQARISC